MPRRERSLATHGCTVRTISSHAPVTIAKLRGAGRSWGRSDPTSPRPAPGRTGPARTEGPEKLWLAPLTAGPPTPLPAGDAGRRQRRRFERHPAQVGAP